ncbi:hypothetical protein DESACE_06265 [Desulfurella acetivorans A63]|nr:hypothetical protein DESACE_06265 [Desulfurella acetivorans A63]
MYYSSIPKNFQTILDYIADKSELYINRDYSDIFNTVCLPIRKGGHFIGTICFKIYKTSYFSDIDHHLLQTLSNLFVVSIENCRYINEREYLRKILEERKKELEIKICELEKANAKITEAQKNQIISEERNRIALDLHDTIAQVFLTIGLNMEWCLRKIPEESDVYKQIKITKDLSKKAVSQIRDTIFDLSFNPERSFLDLVHDLVKEFENLTDIKINVFVHGELKRYTIQQNKVIYTIINESLHNIIKHAQATEATISVKLFKEKTIIEISDNGKGIKRNNIKKMTSGKNFGLKIMFKKIKEINGNIEIINLEPKGTKIIFTIPDDNKT